ncbi:GNAT family N-acetyltransferase [uncultured Imperialibacter sp.]|uniref:GNAT family N-acetyltransferase n=1 Tax=uncultured Imperialibacter sp. TaxID=1672639 RepID=UPI0030DC67F7|tara:strand:+ start:1720 stop:2127 length:408 start_codon:yes stop_codon:yes gene_type:complete
MKEKPIVAHDLVITALQKTDSLPCHLLLIADPSKHTIDKYISDSIVYKADLKGRTIGCYALFGVDNETVEIKNIAVDESFQGKGIGTILLNDAIEKAKLKGLKKIIIGTGNSSVGQLYLYQKVGFRITGKKPDFF